MMVIDRMIILEFLSEKQIHSTGKSLSEALIFVSINPQYDNRLFMELPWKLQAQNMGRTKIYLYVQT